MATRKIHGKVIQQARASHTGRDGDLFFDDSSNQFFISDGSTAGGVPLVLHYIRNVVSATSDTTLTVAQSGSVCSGSKADGITITLPGAAAGLHMLSTLQLPLHQMRSQLQRQVLLIRCKVN